MQHFNQSVALWPLGKKLTMAWRSTAMFHWPFVWFTADASSRIEQWTVLRSFTSGHISFGCLDSRENSLEMRRIRCEQRDFLRGRHKQSQKPCLVMNDRMHTGACAINRNQPGIPSGITQGRLYEKTFLFHRLEEVSSQVLPGLGLFALCGVIAVGGLGRHHHQWLGGW